MNAIFRWDTLALATGAVAAGLFLNYQWLKESYQDNTQDNTVVEMRESRQARQADFDNCARMLAVWPHDSSSGAFSEYPFLPDRYWTLLEKCDNYRMVAEGVR